MCLKNAGYYTKCIYISFNKIVLWGRYYYSTFTAKEIKFQNGKVN